MSLPFPVYGNFCGPGWGDFENEPVDGLDALCKEHDSGYEQGHYLSADQKFVRQLRTSRRFTAHAIAGLFERIIIPLREKGILKGTSIKQPIQTRPHSVQTPGSYLGVSSSVVRSGATGFQSGIVDFYVRSNGSHNYGTWTGESWGGRAGTTPYDDGNFVVFPQFKSALYRITCRVNGLTATGVNTAYLGLFIATNDDPFVIPLGHTTKIPVTGGYEYRWYFNAALFNQTADNLRENGYVEVIIAVGQRPDTNPIGCIPVLHVLGSTAEIGWATGTSVVAFTYQGLVPWANGNAF